MKPMNSCWGHEPYEGRTQHDAQDGWTEDGRRKMVTVVSHWAPIQCTHLLAASDAALYEAKRRGRGQVAVAARHNVERPGLRPVPRPDRAASTR